MSTPFLPGSEKKKVTPKRSFKSAENRAASSLWVGDHRYTRYLCASKLLWVYYVPKVEANPRPIRNLRKSLLFLKSLKTYQTSTISFRECPYIIPRIATAGAILVTGGLEKILKPAMAVAAALFSAPAPAPAVSTIDEKGTGGGGGKGNRHRHRHRRFQNRRKGHRRWRRKG